MFSKETSFCDFAGHSNRHGIDSRPYRPEYSYHVTLIYLYAAISTQSVAGAAAITMIIAKLSGAVSRGHGIRLSYQALSLT